MAATHGVSSQSRSSPAGTRRPHRGKSPVPCSHSGRPLAWLRSSKQGATLSMWSRRGASRADVECEGLVHRKVLCEMRSVMVARSWPADDQEDSVGQHVGRRRIPTRAGGRGGAPASPASSHAATASRPAPADILPRQLSEATALNARGRAPRCLLGQAGGSRSRLPPVVFIESPLARVGCVGAGAGTFHGIMPRRTFP